jgi:hypothetical protein
MNRRELKTVLDQEGIDPEAYDLRGGSPNEKYTIESGVGGWFVYYSERGKRSGEKFFVTEDAACRYLLEWLLGDASTRLSTRAEPKTNL